MFKQFTLDDSEGIFSLTRGIIKQLILVSKLSESDLILRLVESVKFLEHLFIAKTDDIVRKAFSVNM